MQYQFICCLTFEKIFGGDVWESEYFEGKKRMVFLNRKKRSILDLMAGYLF